jgi:tRNA G37 N-methylase TrmD
MVAPDVIVAMTAFVCAFISCKLVTAKDCRSLSKAPRTVATCWAYEALKSKAKTPLAAKSIILGNDVLCSGRD